MYQEKLEGLGRMMEEGRMLQHKSRATASAAGTGGGPTPSLGRGDSLRRRHFY